MAGPIVLPALGPSIFHTRHQHIETPFSAISLASPKLRLRSDSIHSAVEELPRCRDANVVVIGTNTAGLTLAVTFSSRYNVVACEPSEKRAKDVEAYLQKKQIKCTTDPRVISQATHVLVTAGTAVTPKDEVDTTSIRAAIDLVGAHARPGATIVLESSLPVGMSRELLDPLMRTKHFKCGVSPERVAVHNAQSPPKMISGFDEISLAAIQDLYSPVFDVLVSVPQPEVAEMTALYENAQRMMAIALANEMADACLQLSSRLTKNAVHTSKGSSVSPIIIDPREVIQTVSTRKSDFTPAIPSLGLDDSSVSENTSRLLSTADFPLLTQCRQRMRQRPARLGSKLMSNILLRKARLQKLPGKRTRPRVLIIGMGFKRGGRSSLTPSPGAALAQHLRNSYDVELEYADPKVEQSSVQGVERMDLEKCWNEEYLSRFDAVAVAASVGKLDVSVLEEAEDNGLYVEWYCAP